jgi:hypothetical protein
VGRRQPILDYRALAAGPGQFRIVLGIFWDFWDFGDFLDFLGFLGFFGFLDFWDF